MRYIVTAAGNYAGSERRWHSSCQCRARRDGLVEADGLEMEWGYVRVSDCGAGALCRRS